MVKGHPVSRLGNPTPVDIFATRPLGSHYERATTKSSPYSEFREMENMALRALVPRTDVYQKSHLAAKA